MHLPFLSLRQTITSWGQVSRHFSQQASHTLFSLLLGSAISTATVLLPPATPPAQAQSVQNLIIQRSLRLGDRGADVLQLQQALIQRGHLNINIPPNAREGYFGPATKTALQEYQRSQPDLQADGILGEATFRRLFAIGLAPTQTYSIALMQAQLGELGYYNSSLDGEFGPITERALRDLRDETFVTLDTRAGGLENTFDVVSNYYDQQRQQQDLPHPDILESRVENQLPQAKLFGFSNNGFISNRLNNTVSVAPIADRSTPYRAIVPLGRGNDPAELASLRTFVGSVVVAEDPSRGRYAQVGAYGDRGNAQEMVAYLRSQGFDARVIYN